MAFNISTFLASMKFGGARAALFDVTITNPVNSVADIQTPFRVQATQIPGETINNIEVPFFGRPAKFAGTRTYEDWTTTVIEDEDYAIRNALEEWSYALNGPQNNIRNLASASPALYQSTAQVTQYSKTGAPLRIYELVGLWPQIIAPIELSWENGEQIVTYDVTWTYQYHRPVGGVTGTAGQ